MTFAVNINGAEHFVAREAITALRMRILDAIRAGGDFVDVPTVTGAVPVELVTVTTPVRIEAIPGVLDWDAVADDWTSAFPSFSD